MSILAFDLATVSGWALGNTDGVESYGRLVLPRTGDDYGAFGWAAMAQFLALLKRLRPDEVWYESPILPRVGALKTLRKLYPLGMLLEMAASTMGIEIPVNEANIGDIRAHFLGHGHVPRGSARVKAAVKVRCRERGWKPADDNEADALALLDYALSVTSPAHALGATPLFAA